MACKSMEFKKFHRRIKRTLYVANNCDRRSLMAQMAKKASNFLIDNFNSGDFDNMADKLGNQGYVSPCNMLTALVYIIRLKELNEKDFLSFNPTELFVSSLMLATKYLNDGTMHEFVWNDEWASASGLALAKLNELEMRLLDSLCWDVSIQPDHFEKILAKFEECVAVEMTRQNGIMSYNELHILSNIQGFNRSIRCLLVLLLKFLAVLLTLHIALLAGLSLLGIAFPGKLELLTTDACIYYHGWDDCSRQHFLLEDGRKINGNVTKIAQTDNFFAHFHAFWPLLIF